MNRKAELSLRKQHLDAGLDPADLVYLDTPPPNRKATTVRGVSID